MKRDHPSQSAGFSLVELLVVSCIVMLFAAIVTQGLGSLQSARTVQDAAERFAADLRLARVAAISTGSRSRVAFFPSTPGGWDYGCYVFHVPTLPAAPVVWMSPAVSGSGGTMAVEKIPVALTSRPQSLVGQWIRNPEVRRLRTWSAPVKVESALLDGFDRGNPAAWVDEPARLWGRPDGRRLHPDSPFPANYAATPREPVHPLVGAFGPAEEIYHPANQAMVPVNTLYPSGLTVERFPSQAVAEMVPCLEFDAAGRPVCRIASQLEFVFTHENNPNLRYVVRVDRSTGRVAMEELP